jgi:hypothetical protein
MKEKFKLLASSLSQEEADKIWELFYLLLENYQDNKINVYSEIKDFDILIIYKVLNLFSDEQAN